MLVRRAIALLDPQPGDRIADFFCGLGNFSLAIARSRRTRYRHRGQSRPAAACPGECRTQWAGGKLPVRRARPVRDHAANDWSGLAPFDRILIDPPRDGAIALVKAIGAIAARAYRLRILQSGYAGARRGGAGAFTRLSAGRGGRGEHVPAHLARGIDCAVRDGLNGKSERKKGNPMGCPFLDARQNQSRSPENAMSRCSRLAKMLNRLMYTPVAAMM